MNARIIVAFVVLLSLAVAQTVPDLPFPDNPDRSQCGIPTPWGKDTGARLDGHYNGQLVQPRVYLYDSHFRARITGSAPTGSRVKVVMFQQNPVLNYYFVRTINTGKPQEGWVPAPFLKLEQP